MNENFKQDNRKEILKLITMGVCLLELVIAICTFFYQQDTQSQTETPISEEMARTYIDHPEKLKENERLAVNLHSSNPNAYMLITNTVVHHPFPWKGWILISIGTPVTLAFLIVLVAKAYCQVAELEEQTPESVENKWINGVNRLNKVNISWLLLVLIVIVLVFWYLPEFIDLIEKITADWLARFWWIPVMVCTFAFFLVVIWFFLQYRLKLRAMEMNMEIERLKLLHDGDENVMSAIEHHDTGGNLLIDNP